MSDTTAAPVPDPEDVERLDDGTVQFVEGEEAEPLPDPEQPEGASDDEDEE
jgi:hypothetical protein